MKIPRYWAQESKSVQDLYGKWLKLAVWQWSDESTVHAKLQAVARIGALVAKLQNGESLNRYSYGERPLREEVLQAVSTDRGQEAGVITRNPYGVAVLNTVNAMFVDIDFADEHPSPAAEQRAMASVENWVARNVGLGLRVYRTAAGMRGLITNELFDPTKDSTLAMLRELGCDPLYVRLCRDQGCFRARLTAKPWRCHVTKPPSRYPWENADAERRYRAWEQKYKAASAKYAACRLLKQIGNPEVHRDIAPVLAMHDQTTGIDTKLPLA